MLSTKFFQDFVSIYRSKNFRRSTDSLFIQALLQAFHVTKPNTSSFEMIWWNLSLSLPRVKSSEAKKLSFVEWHKAQSIRLSPFVDNVILWTYTISCFRNTAMTLFSFIRNILIITLQWFYQIQRDSIVITKLTFQYEVSNSRRYILICG